MSANEPAHSAKMTLRVADMTCGHCAAAITKAVKAGVPGSDVHADPVSKLVTVSGATDKAAVLALIARAGFTPVAV